MINLPFDSPRPPRTAIPGNRDFLVSPGCKKVQKSLQEYEDKGDEWKADRNV